jgi:hypothetical protein
MLQNTALHTLCCQHYTRFHHALHYSVLFAGYDNVFQLTGGGDHQSEDTESQLDPKYDTVWFPR